MAQTRTRLASTIDQLVYRVHPKTIATRQIHGVKAAFVNSDGSLRADRVAIAAGAVVGFCGLVIGIRKIVS